MGTRVNYFLKDGDANGGFVCAVLYSNARGETDPVTYFEAMAKASPGPTTLTRELLQMTYPKGDRQEGQYIFSLDATPEDNELTITVYWTVKGEAVFSRNSTRRESYYCWRELLTVDGEEEPRLLVPWADPQVYEYPADLLFDTAEEARGWKKQDAPTESWYLCESLLTTVTDAPESEPEIE